MKIIETPKTETQLTRDEWIAQFIALWPSDGAPVSVPTNYRDLGGAVRFRLFDGHVVEWRWKDATPREAFDEAWALIP